MKHGFKSFRQKHFFKKCIDECQNFCKEKMGCKFFVKDNNSEEKISINPDLCLSFKKAEKKQ